MSEYTEAIIVLAGLVYGLIGTCIARLYFGDGDQIDDDDLTDEEFVKFHGIRKCNYCGSNGLAPRCDNCGAHYG